LSTLGDSRRKRFRRLKRRLYSMNRALMCQWRAAFVICYCGLPEIAKIFFGSRHFFFALHSQNSFPYT